MKHKSVPRYDNADMISSNANTLLKGLDSALGSVNVSILFASSPKRPDPTFTGHSGKIAINTGPCPNEKIDTHSP